jgi:hypothetical protein
MPSLGEGYSEKNQNTAFHEVTTEQWGSTNIDFIFRSLTKSLPKIPRPTDAVFVCKNFVCGR